MIENIYRTNKSDPKYKQKSKITLYLNDKINDYEIRRNNNKIKSGRSNSLTIIECIEAILYVLIEGITWNIASKIISGNYKYKSTLNRRFNNWVKAGIFKDTYDKILEEYLAEHDIDEVHIDSTDIQNKNLPKAHTYKSFKLSKQSIRLTILGDNNKAPIDYAIDRAKDPDNTLGYSMLMKTTLKVKNKINVYGDKGYCMNDMKKTNILKHCKLQLVVPKKRYKKRQINAKYKRKIIRHSRQMKEGLKRRVKIEHLNSDIHRSYKRIDKINEKKLETFDAFVKLAMTIILINKTHKP
jgi:hypothetical protein